MSTILPDLLHLGDMRDARDGAKYGTIVSMACPPTPSMTSKGPYIIESVIEDVDTSDIIAPVAFVLENLCVETAQPPILVHCAAGVSRSASCAAALLMVLCGVSYVDALAVLRKGRPIARPNDGFDAQLHVLDRVLRERSARDFALLRMHHHVVQRGWAVTEQLQRANASAGVKSARGWDDASWDIMDTTPAVTAADLGSDAILARCHAALQLIMRHRARLATLATATSTDAAWDSIEHAGPLARICAFAAAARAIVEAGGEALHAAAPPSATSLLPLHSSSYVCMNCSGMLASSLDVVDVHDSGSAPSSSCNMILTVPLERLYFASGAATTSGGAASATAVFTPSFRGYRWKPASPGEVREARCPGCSSKIGGWVYGKLACGCGADVAPAFYLLSSRVRERKL